MQIFLASDHRGFTLKNKLATDLAQVQTSEGNRIGIIDLGPKNYNPDDDFNDAAIAVSKAIIESQKTGNEESLGILICGSAIGVSIQANRFKGIRAAVVSDIEMATSSRAHNDANIICLSADHLTNAKDPLESEASYEDLLAIVETFITTPFSGETRYVRRIKRLDEEIQ